ncbi:MAG TPA: M48 family metallopeptidase [Pyrinomonadaceae bacterium]|jgi:Zn-dependent protease with chaperone function
MKKFNLSTSLTSIALVWAMLLMPLAAMAQTNVKAPKNKYKVQDDIKIGREASAEVEKQFPILNNETEATRYVESVGRKLVAAIPAQYQHPEFQFSFKIVNARDINAFALPGGPMYVNRGMIDAATNEGEMAGVMAHEISHVALRHGTAQATQQSNPLNQILGIGAILGGAILGGQTGAAIGQTIYSGLLVYPYSRDYETQADTLGAQIMANAGYDPTDLANMFKTIEKESGGSNGPDWLSTHPNPANRYENISRERQLLRISSNPIRNTAQFERTQARLRQLPRAQTMAEIEKNAKTNQQGQTQTPTANGKYESRVEIPSTRTRAYSGGNWVRMNIPGNWQEFPAESEVWFAPQGAYGDRGITHGALMGIYRGNSNDLSQATQDYVDGILQSNDYLRKRSNYSQTTVGNRQGYGIALSGRSPITGRNEIATVYTTMLSNGDLFYIVTVSPENEATSYNNAFRNMIRSIRLSD